MLASSPYRICLAFFFLILARGNTQALDLEPEGFTVSVDLSEWPFDSLKGRLIALKPIGRSIDSYFFFDSKPFEEGSKQSVERDGVPQGNYQITVLSTDALLGDTFAEIGRISVPKQSVVRIPILKFARVDIRLEAELWGKGFDYMEIVSLRGAPQYRCAFLLSPGEGVWPFALPGRKFHLYASTFRGDRTDLGTLKLSGPGSSEEVATTVVISKDARNKIMAREVNDAGPKTNEHPGLQAPSSQSK